MEAKVPRPRAWTFGGGDGGRGPTRASKGSESDDAESARMVPGEALLGKGAGLAPRSDGNSSSMRSRLARGIGDLDLLLRGE